MCLIHLFAIIILPIATGMQFIFSSEEMHAILTHPEIKEIVEWTPHGRSWRIVKQRAFENDILPKYFEHSKMTSFVRQVNGWGFRRLSKSNEYYHEFFLRSMPWLVKKMRRPRVSEKKHIDAELEPDFYAISRQFQVPNNRPTREVRALHKVIGEGAKARMPVVWDVDTPPASPSPALPDPTAPQGVANHFAAGFMAAQAYHSNQARNARNELEAALVARIQPPQPQPLGNVTDLLLQRADAVQTARNDLQRAQNELLLQEVAASERERALQLLQRPNQMAGNSLSLQEAAAALINSQPSSLTEQASLQRLQQPIQAPSSLQMAQDDLRLREAAATAAATALLNSQPNGALSEQASLNHLQELQRARNSLRLQEAAAALNSQPSTLSEQELQRQIQELRGLNGTFPPFNL